MTDLAVIENPFRNAPVVAAPSHEALSSVIAGREVAEVQASMTIARRFPRSEVDVVDKILQACTRPTLAEGALYEFARGGSEIRGPSIRLAEMLAQYWGHLDFGWRTLEERDGVTKVQAFCWDMQTGVRSQRVFDVTHVRMAGGQKRILMDPRDVYEHVANSASRRLRACILNVIPGDVVEAAQKQCEATLQLKVQVTPERVQNMVTQFAELGVSKAAIEKRVQRRVDAITPGLFHQLGKIYTSLRDSMSQPGDWFDMTAGQPDVLPVPASVGPAVGPPGPRETPSPRAAVRERLQARRPSASPRSDPPQAQASEPLTGPTEPSAPPPDHPYPGPMEAPLPSQALQDVIRFARAAQTQEDVGRVRHIAMQLEDEQEAIVAQQHISAAVTRIG